MKKLTVFFATFLFLTFAGSLSGSLSYAETLSLSTYYPAPFGVYNQLRLVPSGAPTCSANLDGLLWVDTNTLELMMCQGGTAMKAPGVWTQDDATPAVYVSDLDPGSADYNAALQVGIGTLSPAARLEVEDASTTVINVDSTSGSGVGINLSESDTARSSLFASNTSALEVHDSTGTPQLIIEQDGDTALGSVAPTAGFKLDVTGALRSEGITLFDSTTATDNRLLMGFNDTNDYGFISPWDNTNSTWENLCINCGGGNVGIGVNHSDVDPVTGSVPQLTIGDGLSSTNGNTWVRGHLTVSTQGATCGSPPCTPPRVGNVTAHAYFYISDESFKDNIEPVSGLDAVMRLKGVKFKWKDTESYDIGVVAQNVEKVFPELVNTSPVTNVKAVKVGNLVAPLIEAIKEQQEQIEELKKEIKELKTQQF